MVLRPSCGLAIRLMSEDIEDMITLALNSDPDDIDFSKEFVYEYLVDENRYRKAYGRAIKCLYDYELEEMLDNGEIA